jgi:hypothetical protein
MKAWFRGLHKTECDEVRELLSPYLDGELDSDERQRVDSHIESCQSCREALSSLRETVSLIQSMPIIEPSRSFAISETVKKSWDSKLKALSVATAFVALFLAIVFVGDIRHYFDTPPLPAPPWPQPPEVDKYYWPVRETEFGLLGLIVVLVIATFVYWRKRVGGLLRRK